MAACVCPAPSRLHIDMGGVHLADGRESPLLLVDEVWVDNDPVCGICAAVIPSTFYRCTPCDAVICHDCVTRETSIVECDCDAEVRVTGVQLAARRAAARLVG